MGQSAKSFQPLSDNLWERGLCGIVGPMAGFGVMFFVVPLLLVGLAALVSVRTGRRGE